jgi:hypothetical protein
MLGPMCSCGHVIYDHCDCGNICGGMGCERCHFIDGCTCEEFDHDLDQQMFAA